MKTLPLRLLVLSFLLFSLTTCDYDSNLATTSSSKRQAIYDFFNDVRAEIAPLELEYGVLKGFNEQTKNYLEDRESQRFLYTLSGLYFEKNLDRKSGARDYENRFFEDGCVIHIVLLPPDDAPRYEAVVGIDKGYGTQVGKNFLYYQIFTARPVLPDLEEQLLNIVRDNLKKHAATLGQVAL